MRGSWVLAYMKAESFRQWGPWELACLPRPLMPVIPASRESSRSPAWCASLRRDPARTRDFPGSPGCSSASSRLYVSSGVSGVTGANAYATASSVSLSSDSVSLESGFGFQFHGLGGSVIDTWHVELKPRCRQQGVLVVQDVRFFRRSQVRVLAGDEDILGRVRFHPVRDLDPRACHQRTRSARTQGVPVRGCDPRRCRRTRVVRPRVARS